MNWLIEKINEGADMTAVIFKEKEYSYSSCYQSICKDYDRVKETVGIGKVVAIVADYSFASISLFFALHENHNIIVPITTKVQSEIDDRIAVAGCDYVVSINGDEWNCTKREHSDEPHQLVASLQNEGHSGLILFSSGSTGKPKAMIHNLDNLIDTYKDKRGRRLVFLIFLMFDHIGGLNTLLNCLSMNVIMVLPDTREPDHVAHLIETYKVNILPASPTFLNLMLISDCPTRFDLTSLRMITYGTEPMPESLLAKLKDEFPRVKFLQTFGTSETGISATSSYSSTSTFLKIDDPNTEYKIIDGELWLRSKTQIMGYLNSSMERFTDDGWFKTGDMVEEMDGYIKIVGRNSDIINIGGEKVFPSEVESVLLQMSHVKDVIVYGENNPITGQMVVAKVLYDEDIKLSELKKQVVKF
ncbi:MAG TPA: fatty acid--CoA ligase family protein, partial [Saccharofermentans sp.]|nr:fatty acid--CoA ligase family protein [Saccharofermentans sp.]